MCDDKFIELIFEQEGKGNIILSWESNCIHILEDKYLTSFLKKRESNIGGLISDTNMFPCLAIYLQLKHDDVELYSKIKTLLFKFKELDPEIEIIISETTKTMGEIKAGMEDIVTSFERKNAEIMKKYDSLASELLKLCTDELYILPTPKLFSTDGYYDWIDSSAGFEIRCHNLTKFYSYFTNRIHLQQK